MILSSKVLGANGLSCLCRSSLWLHTPVLRPYPITEEQNEYIFATWTVCYLSPFWTNTEYIHIAQIIIEQNELSSITPNTLANFVFGLLECHYCVSKKTLDFYIANSFPIKSLFDRII